MEEFLRETKRRIEAITTTGWGIKEGISCGGLRTSRPTCPWAFERELKGRARCPQRAGEKGKIKFTAV